MCPVNDYCLVMPIIPNYASIILSRPTRSIIIGASSIVFNNSGVHLGEWEGAFALILSCWSFSFYMATLKKKMHGCWNYCEFMIILFLFLFCFTTFHPYIPEHLEKISLLPVILWHGRPSHFFMWISLYESDKQKLWSVLSPGHSA